jgi:ATP-dependent Clp protease protease subunit
MGNGYSMRAAGSSAAEIYIYEDVGEGWFGGVSAKQFAEDLKALGQVQTIDLRINSYGGEVFDGIAIYRQLVEHPARIVAHIDGVAASIASVIAMAGDEIRIAQAGFLMIHPAQGGVLGSAVDMRYMAELLDKITASIMDVYERRTGADRTQIEAWVAADTWFTAQEAQAAGFADVIDENMLLAARADAEHHRDKFRSDQQAATGNRSIIRPAAAELVRLRDAAAALDVPVPAARPQLDAATRKISRMQARLTLASSTQPQGA